MTAVKDHNHNQSTFTFSLTFTCNLRFSRLHHRKSHLEKAGHSAGPVLKPDDHVDCRSMRMVDRGKGDKRDEVIMRMGGSRKQEDEVALEEPTQEEISQAIGVNCAQIIQNITLGEEEMDF